MTATLARHDAAVAEYLAALRDAVGRGYVMKEYNAALHTKTTGYFNKC